MNLLLLEEKDFLPSGEARISGRRHRQLKDVIKAVPGKRCRAGILGGMRGHAEIIACEEDSSLLRFTEEDPPPPPLPVTLLIALPRPQTYTKVLNCAVEMGVKRIDFINSFKVEKSFWQGSRLSEAYLENEETFYASYDYTLMNSQEDYEDDSRAAELLYEEIYGSHAEQPADGTA